MTMTIDQLRIAISEAANYTDVYIFVSCLLLSSAFLSPVDDRSEPDLSQSANLRKVWMAVNAPFRDFLAAFGVKQTKLSHRFGIPIRTIQDWAGERRSCPIYVRKMMATLLILDNAMQDVEPLSNDQIADIIELYNRSEAKGAAALTEMDSDNAKISARGDKNFDMAYSEMGAIDQMLRILGYKIITDDGSDEAIDIKRIDYDREYDREINGYDRGNWSGLQSDN